MTEVTWDGTFAPDTSPTLAAEQAAYNAQKKEEDDRQLRVVALGYACQIAGYVGHEVIYTDILRAAGGFLDFLEGRP